MDTIQSLSLHNSTYFNFKIWLRFLNSDSCLHHFIIVIYDVVHLEISLIYETGCCRMISNELGLRKNKK